MRKKVFQHAGALIIAAIILTFFTMSWAMYNNTAEQLRVSVRNECEYYRYFLDKMGDDSLDKPAGKITASRVTLIDTDGTVLFDSVEDENMMGNHSGRPEVIEAEKTGESNISRYSETLRSKTYYTALRLDNGKIIRVPGVKEVLTCFFCYCAVESTAGMWAASYCTLFRGIDAKRAASWASLFYIGITIGRFFCGFITMKLNDQKMIRLGQAVIAVGTILMLLPLGDSLLFIGLILIGLGCAPIYPSIIHETPANFGADLSQGIIGIQMAFAYVGTCLMPPVFGVLGQHISFGLYPVFLMAILILMVVMAERMHRVTAEKRNSYKANY